MRSLLGCLAALALLIPAALAADAPERAGIVAGDDAGAERIGHPAPAWSFDRWARDPQTLAALRGRVVLVRWWTEGCDFCANTLPALETLRAKHAGDGLVVVGVFHPKPPHHVTDGHI